VEIVQEFKVENNSFFVEFGNNGGTVVNIVLKRVGTIFTAAAGGSGSAPPRANDSSATGNSETCVRDQYGFSLRPIKNRRRFSLWISKRFARTIRRKSMPLCLHRRKGRLPQHFCRLHRFQSGLRCRGSRAQHIFNPFNLDASGNRQISQFPT
jgi:hypothetical protein